MTSYTSQGVSMQADVGSGLAEIGELKSVGGFGVTRNALDATTLSSTFEKVKAGLIRPGTLNCLVNYDPADAQHAYFWSQVTSQNQTDMSVRLDLNDASPSEYFDVDVLIMNFQFQGLTPDSLVEATIDMKMNTIPSKTT